MGPSRTRRLALNVAAIAAFLSTLLAGHPETIAQQIRFSFPDGNPMLALEEIIQQPDFFQLKIQLVRDPHVQQEIEMVAEQTQQLAQIVEEHFQVRRKLGSAGPSWPPKTANDLASRELERRRRELESQTLQKLDAVLLPHQTERLQSVIYWIAANKNGLAFVADSIAEQMGATLTGAERQAIQEFQAQGDRELMEYCLTEYRSLITRTVEKYPVYEGYLNPWANSATLLSLDILFAFGENFDSLSPQLLSAPLSELVRDPHRAVCQTNGNWMLSDESHEPACYEMTNLLFYKSGDHGGLIGRDQRPAIVNWSNDCFRRLAEAKRQMEAELARGVERDLAGRSYRKAKERIDQEAMRQFQEEILLPAQSEWLVQALRQRKRNSYGLPGILLMETADDGTPISDAERADVRKFLKTEIRALRNNITRQFHETVQRQISRLPESIQRETERRIGEPPQYLIPNLTALTNRTPSDSKSPQAAENR